MGIKNRIRRAGTQAGNKIARLASLSPEQLEKIENQRERYLSEMPNPDDPQAIELTQRLLAASGVEIYNAYLSQLADFYVPIEKKIEYNSEFKSSYNIRYFKITKWVTDKKENSLKKLINVYEVLSNEDCNIALIFHRKMTKTDVYLAVTNLKNANDNNDVSNYQKRIGEAIYGNFPGAQCEDGEGIGIIPCLNNNYSYSIATATNIPTEKSDEFISQTIEKLLDGIIPKKRTQEYTIMLLATPIHDIEERKLRLSEFYTGLAPYAGWSTNYTYQESDAASSSATVGINVGTSAGIQHGQNQGVVNTSGSSNSQGTSNTNSTGTAKSLGSSHTKGSNKSITGTVGGRIGNENMGINGSIGTTKGTFESDTASKSTSNTVGHAIAKSLGKAVSRSVATTSGIFGAVNLGVNFGANFARSSSVTEVIGKNEGITQQYTNYNIKHTLELLSEQMKRYEESTALGMWDFAAYVLSEDHNVANNVAHSYLALTQGEKSYMSHSVVHIWRGDLGERSKDAKEICSYLRELRHPIFGLNPELVAQDSSFYVYPSAVTATTSLTGKELAYSLNFPRKSIAGLPILECAEFGRNVTTYDEKLNDEKVIQLGKIFHMNHQERTDVDLFLESLRSHTFITGSTGSGKSNTIYHILNCAREEDIHFLVIEPAKGEYKNVFGNEEDVSVYGTNPLIAPLLRINPFSFSNDIHVLEHMDRLVEIFNVCWPMYAAMPAVLKSAVEKSYIDCGWNLITSENKYDQTLFPTFADVARNIKTIIDLSEYDSENKGAYKGSLLTRLQSLTTGINAMIFSPDDISDKQLFDENVIIDLSRVGSSETKSLIMGMLVLKLQEYRMSSDLQMNTSLRHLTVLEEAHNLLRRTSIDQPTESSNMLGKSVEMLANSIAEMRTYGEGFIIADQAPGLMDMSVIRNTNTKIIMRLPDQSDRELVGKAASLNEDQIEELAKLPCGVAAIYQNEWLQPVLCKIIHYDDKNQKYHFSKTVNKELLDKNNNLSQSLLEIIMDHELLQTGDKADMRELKDLVIRSGFDTVVKIDFLKYLDAENEQGIENLKKLLYDFLDAEQAIEKSQKYDDIHEWYNSMIDHLKPSIKNYSKQQIDLVVALILLEKAGRNHEYQNVLNAFTDMYRKRGEMF